VSAPSNKKRPIRAALVLLAKAAGYGLVLVVALAIGILAHVDTPVARQLVAKQVSDGLATLFEGKIVLDHVDDLGVRGMRGADAHVTAPDGTNVIVAHGMRAHVNPWALVKSIASGRGTIRVFDIQIDDAEVVLDEDGKGSLKIARAFELDRNLPKGGKPPPPLGVELSRIHVGHVWIHGRITGASILDGDADNVDGEVHIVVGKSVQVKVLHLDLNTRGLPSGANVNGVVTGHVTIPSASGNLIGLGGTVAGLYGQVPVRGDLSLDGESWHAALTADQVDAARIRAMFPGAPLYGPVAVHAEVNGPLQALVFDTHATLGKGSVDARGRLALHDGVAADVHLETRELDARSFEPTAKETRLTASADVQVHEGGGKPLGGTYALRTDATVIDGQSVPAAELHGTFDQIRPGTAGDAGIMVTTIGKVMEPGAPTDVDLTLHPAEGGGTVSFVVHTIAANVGAVPRIALPVHGRADVTARGTLVLGKVPRIDTTVTGSLAGIGRDEVTVAHATIAGHAVGRWDDPAFDATTTLQNVRAGNLVWDDVKATASGSRAQIGVTASAHGKQTPSLEGSTTVTMGPGLTLTRTNVALRRRTTALEARIARIFVGQGQLAIQEAELTGLGEPVHASVERRGGVLQVRANGAQVNLASLAYLLRMEDRLKQGTASFAVDLRSARDHADGTAKFHVNAVTWEGLTGIDAFGDLTLQGRDIGGTASASVAGIGKVDVTQANVHVGGSGPLEETSWRKGFGDVTLDGEVDLARALALLPAGALPPMDLRGILHVSGHTRRTSETDAAPEVDLAFQTRGLRASARKAPDATASGTTLVNKPAWELRGFDATADVRIKGGSGHVNATVTDALGPLVTVDASSASLPYADLVGPDGVAALLRHPMTTHVHVPPRELATLPELVRPDAVRGFLELDATMTGAAMAPSILLDGNARGLTFSAMPDAQPLDLAAHGTYAGNAADVAIDVSSPKESYMHTAAHANVDLGALLFGAGDPRWTGSARATLVHFPLGAVAQLADRDVRGRISGEVALTGYHDDAHAQATLTTDRLSIGRSRFTKAAVTATYDGHSLAANARLDQKDGFAEANGQMAMTWGRAWSPSPSANGEVTLALVSKHFQASFLEPLLSATVDELDGLLDADARISLAASRPPAMSGTVLFHDGRVIPSATGEELHGINAKMVLAENGTLTLSDMVAQGTTGKVTASGGAHIAGLSVSDATVKLAIAKNDAMPLSLGGSVLGSGYGSLTISAANVDPRSAKVKIDVADFHVELPEANPREVQDLAPPADNVHVGVYTAPREFKVIGKTRNDVARRNASDKPMEVEIAVRLGTVEVSRGTELRAVLGGETTLESGDKTTMRGQIRLRSGKLEVQGKPFEIQKGTATFVGDPQNPEVDVTASWKAGDGTEVFADYIGPLKTGKVVLRSEPPRPQNEIVALILFGTADGSSSTPYAQPQTDTTTKVGSAVGGFATGGLNKGIDKLTGMDISTKIDTSQANPRPEVELRIARDLSLQLAFVLGTPPPGTNQDTTYATIDWRFFRNWSLATTFGNLGSSMADILWRYRY
jgi:translocation and assembly module TamB